MAEHSTSPVEPVIMFDIFNENDFENNEFIADNMTKEEEEEVANVVSLLDSVNSKELVDFATQQTEHRHRSVTEAELDHLASKTMLRPLYIKQNGQ